MGRTRVPTEAEIITQQQEVIESLQDQLYTIQVTGSITPMPLSKKSFRKFILKNIEVKDWLDKYLANKYVDMERNYQKMVNLVEANKETWKQQGKHYIRVATYLNVKEMLSSIINCQDDYYTLSNGYKVKTTSLRYQTFNQSIECVDCGLKGQFLALERDLYDKGGNEGDREGEGFHLNLYALNNKGEEVLMTKDHIKPKSKGGANHISNMQTMCTNCNGKKGDKYENIEVYN